MQSGHAVDAVKHLRQYLSAADAAQDKVEAIRAKWLPKAEAYSGLLRVDVSSGLTVAVDDEVVGQTPFALTIPVPPGEHRIDVRRGAAVESRTLLVPAGVMTWVVFEPRTEPTAPPPRLPPPPGSAQPAEQAAPSLARVITIASVGAAATLAGAISIAFVASSNRDADNADSLRTALPGNSACAQAPLPPLCPSLQRAVENQYRHRDLAIGFGITAGALVITDVVLFLVWPSDSAARSAVSQVRVSPAGGGGASLGWETTF